MRPGLLIAALTVGCLPFLGCGQKGPLSLPLPDNAPAPPHAAERAAGPNSETKAAKP